MYILKRPIVWVAGILLLFFMIFRLLAGNELEERYYSMDKELDDSTRAEVSGTLDHVESKPKSYYLYLKKVSVTCKNTKNVYYFSDFLAVMSGFQEDSCQPGNVLLISGSVKSFDVPTNPGQFDERSYYKEKNIYYKVYGDSCRIMSPENNQILIAVYRVKDALKQVYQKCLPEKDAGIITAMLLGDRSTLDVDVRQLYQVNGIGHLLAISGLHISIICMALYRGLRLIFYLIESFIPQESSVFSFYRKYIEKIPFLLTCCFLLFYGKMTGFGISTSRAVVMMILALLAGELGKSYDAFTAMGVSGILIWLQNPYAVTSSSFLLSYSAMAGVYLVLPALEIFFFGTLKEQRARLRESRRRERELTANIPLKKRSSCSDAHTNIFTLISPLSIKMMSFLIVGKKKLISSLLCSFAIWLATLPVLCWFFYEFPTYGIVLNLFVLPLASVLVIAGMLGGVLGVFFLPLGKCILFPVHGILSFYEAVCRLFQKLPQSVQITGRPRTESILLYYLVLFFLCLILTKKMGRRESFIRYSRIAVSCLLALGMTALFSVEKVKGFSCTVMDVGQGDGLVLRTESGKTVLVDGGSSSVSQVGKYRILPFLKYYGIRHIDYMIVTHEDEDHISGQMELVETGKASGISVGCLLMPEPDVSCTGKNYSRMEELAREAQIPLNKIHRGDRIVLGELSLRCLHPAKGFAAESANAYSTTLDVHYRGRSMLLTGDLEKNGEAAVTETLENYEILKVAHHGSKNSSAEEYLAKVQPRAAVISCGKDNRYGHPHRELLERLALYTDKIYRTDESGAVFLETDGRGWRIRGYRDGADFPVR